MQCPFCGSTQLDTDYVDVGVGPMLRVAPYLCMNCGAGEAMPGDRMERATAEERAVGWYMALGGPILDIKVDPEIPAGVARLVSDPTRENGAMTVIHLGEQGPGAEHSVRIGGGLTLHVSLRTCRSEPEKHST